MSSLSSSLPRTPLRYRSRDLVRRVRDMRARCLDVPIHPAEALVELRGHLVFSPSSRLTNLVGCVLGVEITDTSDQALLAKCQELKDNNELFVCSVRQFVNYIQPKIVVALFIVQDIWDLRARQYDEDDDELGIAADTIDQLSRESQAFLVELVNRRNDVIKAATQAGHDNLPQPIDTHQVWGVKLVRLLLNRLKVLGFV
jgi:hypothetical protein